MKNVLDRIEELMDQGMSEEDAARIVDWERGGSWDDYEDYDYDDYDDDDYYEDYEDYDEN